MSDIQPANQVSRAHVPPGLDFDSSPRDVPVENDDVVARVVVAVRVPKSFVRRWNLPEDGRVAQGWSPDPANHLDGRAHVVVKLHYRVRVSVEQMNDWKNKNIFNF